MKSLTEMSDTQNRAVHPVHPQQLELMDHEGLALDLDQGLRDRLRERPQTCSQSARENGDRQAHEKTTRVPSKSKRKRTSSRPTLAIAARSEVRSSA